MVAETASVSTAAAPSPGAAVDSPAIHTVDLSKRFGGTVALAGLSMTVPRGEIFGFLGPNGAGKTTSVKLLLGLLKPTSGEAWLLGEKIGDPSSTLIIPIPIQYATSTSLPLIQITADPSPVLSSTALPSATTPDWGPP